MNNTTLPDKRLKRRHRAERRFRFYGQLAIALSFVFLATLLVSLGARGYSAFVKTELQMSVAVTKTDDYTRLLRDALKKEFPVENRMQLMQLYTLLSSDAPGELAAYVKAHPEVMQTGEAKLWLTASSSIDMFFKGKISREVPEAVRKVKDVQIGWLDKFAEEGRVRSTFNSDFFTSADSREPEQAGVLGALVGSLMTIAVCMAVAFPLAVGSAVYLEEFSVRNRFTDLIEVNLNNLAAVPSIVFGLLGLAVYLSFFGMPRSASFVGGLTLALMVLPTMVITTRSAIRTVPPSIRDAASALGASQMQVTLHHVLPLAMPGIMTGTILSIARALGETAPLLMIGMVAFVADVPQRFADPATVLPVQIYLWSDSPEMGFTEKTSACILVLLAILMVMNALAIYLRRKYEHKW